MKHRLAILLVLAMLLCIFVGCRTEGSDNTQEKDPPAAAGTATAEFDPDRRGLEPGRWAKPAAAAGRAWALG